MARILKRLLPLGAAIAAVAFGAYHFGGVGGSTPARAAAPTVFSVDAVPDAAGYTAAPVINSSRTVNVGSSFGVDAVVTWDPTNPPWASYQITLDYTDVVLDAVASTGTWGSAPSADNTSPYKSGNLYPFTGGNLCDPASVNAAIVSEDDANNTAPPNSQGADYAMTCAHASATDTDTTGGTLVRFFFTCDVAGVATLHLEDVNNTFILDNAFASHNDTQVDATINCIVPPTNTPVPPTSTPTKTNTPLPATATPTKTNTPKPTNTPNFSPATMNKVPSNAEGTPLPTCAATPTAGCTNVVIKPGQMPEVNLFLCEVGPCSGANEGDVSFIERAFNPGPTGVGAFEFQIKFDHKIFDINLECVTAADPGPACTLADAATWDIQLSAQLKSGADGRNWSMDQCFRNVTENYINFTCESTGSGNGYTGSVDLAVVTLHPDSDLKFRLTPGNDNGIVRVVLDENCEVADPLGHPINGAIAGGLTATCGDIAVTVRILEGDLNLDCKVDLQDAQRIAQLYGMVFGLFLYDPWFDLEPNIKDFDIDAKDLQKVFGRIGSTCQNPKPPQPPLAPAQGG